MDIQFEVYNSFESVQDIWQNFQQHASLYPFQTFEWLYSWYNTIGVKERIQPYIVIAKSTNNRIVLLLPLGIQNIAFIKRLIWLGGKVTDYNCPIVDPEYFVNNRYDITTLIKKIAPLLPKFDLVYFKKMPEKIAELTNPILNGECYFHVYSSQLVVNTDWTTFFNKQLKASKRDILRKEKKLTEKGPLHFSIAQTEAEIKKVTQTMIEQKGRRYQESGKSNMFKHQYYQDFYVKTGVAYPFLINNPNKLNILVTALYLNNIIVATHWGVKYRQNLYYLMPSYISGELAKCSPGKVMLAKLAEWCFNNDIKTFDLTYGEESYKKDWCNSELKLYQYFLPISNKGKFVLSLLKSVQNYHRKPV